MFIDEIQESPKAIKLLRYFYEKYPEIHVITAGSLLEFAMGKMSSFPVGRIEYLYLHPFNFAEFLTAMGNRLAVETIDNLPIESFSHQVLLDLYHTYALIEGMPGVVETYQRTKNAASLTRIYEGVWDAYQDDVEKYARNESEKRIIRHIMTTAPNELGKRIKFRNFGKSNYSSER